MPGGAVEEIRDRRDIQNLFSNGDANPRSAGRAAATERPIGKILNRKIAVRRIGAGDKAFQRRVVSLIDCH
jgi:hypothetical protein